MALLKTKVWRLDPFLSSGVMLRWVSGSVGSTRRIIASVTVHGQGRSCSWLISAPLVLHVILGPVHCDRFK